MKYCEIIAWVQYTKVEPQNGSNVLQFPYKKHSHSEVGPWNIGTVTCYCEKGRQTYNLS
jgi:hypothetical protein